MSVYICNGMSAMRRKAILPFATCADLEGICAKWNKPDQGRQILLVLLMCGLFKKKNCECFYCWFLRHQWELLLCESHSQLGQNLPGEVFMNIYIHVCTSLTCFPPHTLDAKVYTLSETLIFHAYSYALSCSWNDHVRFGVGNQVFSSDS